MSAAAAAASPVKPDLEMASFLKTFGKFLSPLAAVFTSSISFITSVIFPMSEIKVPIDLNDVS